MESKVYEDDEEKQAPRESVKAEYSEAEAKVEEKMSDDESDAKLRAAERTAAGQSSKEGDDGDDAPESTSELILASAYNQTYVIMKTSSRNEAKEGETTSFSRGVFFRCGNWCYAGNLSFGIDEIGLSDLPRIIPMLQRQQGKLAYFCPAAKIPPSSNYYNALEMHWTAEEFLAQELGSDQVTSELERWAKVFTWIDSDTDCTYFELQVHMPEGAMDDIALIASKSYARGLILITIFHEGRFYCVLQPGEGDQPLLDVRFPDVSRHGQGLHVNSYDQGLPWQKLTLWHAPNLGMPALVPQLREKNLLDLSSDSYIQSYIVMSPTTSVPATQRQALFRFGSWCYSGEVTLTPNITLKDIPHVIPALRIQQNKLSYFCDVTKMPARSPFAPALQKMLQYLPMVEREVGDSEEVLSKLVEKMDSMGLGASVANWLESNSTNSFFEFTMAPNEESKIAFHNIDLVASKCYLSQGLILIMIYFRGQLYVVIKEGGEDQPLLDSQFPDVSGKGRGYQIKAYNRGVEGWPELRKVAVWQTQLSLQMEIQARLQAKEAAEKKESKAPETNTEAEEVKVAVAEHKRERSVEVAEQKPRKEAKQEPTRDDSPKTDVSERKDDAKPEKEQPRLAGLKVNAPHYIAPMQGLEDKLAKMRLEMQKSGEGGEAPWDKFGRPKGLGFK